jgi:hypothetical protein
MPPVVVGNEYGPVGEDGPKCCAPPMEAAAVWPNRPAGIVAEAIFGRWKKIKFKLIIDNDKFI